MTDAALSADTRNSVRDLILVLADTKRVLGMRYAEWLLGAPELEAGIALASMAQDEWGHARLLYALLKDFGDDVDAIEHGRQPAEYCSMQTLDVAPQSWPELVAMNALCDRALSLQLQSLIASSYVPLRQRVQKILDEEQFHSAHGRAWFNRLAQAGGEARAELAAAVARYMPGTLMWFGPDSDGSRAAAAAGLMDGTANDLRVRFIETVTPLLNAVGGTYSADTKQTSWDGYNEATRRNGQSVPDDEIIRKLRGDKNRAFLMD